MGVGWRVAVVADDAETLRVFANGRVEALGAAGVATAASVAEGQRLLASAPFDVVVCGLRIESDSGLDFAHGVRRRWPSLPVMLASPSDAEAVIQEALGAGVTGVLIMPATMAQAAEGLAAVAQGGLWIDPRAVEPVMQGVRTTLSLQMALRHEQERRAQLTQMVRGLTRLASLPHVDDMLPAVVDLARELTQAEYAAMAVLDAHDRIAAFITRGLSDEATRAIGALPRGDGLLGEVIRTRRPLRVLDIRQHPASSGWPAAHPSMTSFLGMPMLFEDAVVGHLYCTNQRDGAFSAEDEEVLGFLANHAAVLIRTARLAQDLERLVLTEERQRLSLELHDGTLQALYGVILTLDGLLAGPANDAALRPALDEVADRLTGITQSIRHTVQDLHQRAADLVTTIHAIVDELGAGERVRVQTADAQFRRVTEPQQEQMAGFVREALSNALRHGEATAVDVTWRADGRTFWLTVRDNGRGFVLDEAQRPGHFGLRHLSQRAERLGGRVIWDSAPGQGTRVTLEAPLSPPPPSFSARDAARLPGSDTSGSSR